MNIEDDVNGAAVKFPPPLIFLILLIVAYGMHHFWPLRIGISSGLRYVGIIAAMLGICAIVFIRQTFKNVETNIEPWKPTTTIISTGIYSHSRNPIYVAFCLILIGAGIFLDSWWVLISVMPSAVLVYYLAIRKEEAYLEKKFGEEYLLYQNEVRRWL